MPSECKYRIKKNRITIILKKEDKNTSWTSLTSKNPSSSNKPTSSDPAAGIMDLMKVDFVTLVYNKCLSCLMGVEHVRGR